MRIITLNANGIRSAAEKGFFEWLSTTDADVVCLQEIKIDLLSLNAQSRFFPEDFHCVYYPAQKKGYSGVAIFARKKPENITYGFGLPCCDDEGRYLQFDYPDYTIVSVYCPSGTTGDERQVVKYAFLEAFEDKLLELKATGHHVIIGGDFNIAHQCIDIKNWRANQKNSGFLPEERAWLDNLFNEIGYVDAFRVLNQLPDQYTWWTYRARAFEKNVGWRIDYQMVTEGVRPLIDAVHIEKSLRFSDHAPLIIDYKGTL